MGWVGVGWGGVGWGGVGWGGVGWGGVGWGEVGWGRVGWGGVGWGGTGWGEVRPPPDTRRLLRPHPSRRPRRPSLLSSPSGAPSSQANPGERRPPLWPAAMASQARATSDAAAVHARAPTPPVYAWQRHAAILVVGRQYRRKFSQVSHEAQEKEFGRCLKFFESFICVGCCVKHFTYDGLRACCC